MKKVSYRTRNGQAIQPYGGAHKDFPVSRIVEGTKSVRQRLCQILPPIPQRFEWINESNIQTVEWPQP